MKSVFVLSLFLLFPLCVAQAQGQSQDDQPHIQPRNMPKEEPPPPPKDQPESEQPKGESSSKDSQLNMNGPVKTSGDNSGVSELLPWDPHKAAKDIEVGQFYLKRKNYRAALDRFNEALRYKPNDAEATFYLAATQDKLEFYDQAYQNYNAYLKLLPDGPLSKQAHEAVSRIAPHVQVKLPSQQDAEQAKQLIQQGEDALTRNDFDSAHTSLVKALQILPDDPTANFRLAESLQGLQRLDEARIFYRKYLGLQPSGKMASEARRQIEVINYTIGK